MRPAPTTPSQRSKQRVQSFFYSTLRQFNNLQNFHQNAFRNIKNDSTILTSQTREYSTNQLTKPRTTHSRPSTTRLQSQTGTKSSLNKNVTKNSQNKNTHNNKTQISEQEITKLESAPHTTHSNPTPILSNSVNNKLPDVNLGLHNHGFAPSAHKSTASRLHKAPQQTRSRISPRKRGSDYDAALYINNPHISGAKSLSQKKQLLFQGSSVMKRVLRFLPFIPMIPVISRAFLGPYIPAVTNPTATSHNFSVKPTYPHVQFETPYLRFAKRGEEVLVNYIARLEDGTIIDSTERRGKPTRMFVGEDYHVIPGLDRALQLIPVGQRAHAIIPHDLAYGARGLPGVVPPYATIFYDIELLQVKGKSREQYLLLKALYKTPDLAAEQSLFVVAANLQVIDKETWIEGKWAGIDAEDGIAPTQLQLGGFTRPRTREHPISRKGDNLYEGLENQLISPVESQVIPLDEAEYKDVPLKVDLFDKPDLKNKYGEFYKGMLMLFPIKLFNGLCQLGLVTEFCVNSNNNSNNNNQGNFVQIDLEIVKHLFFNFFSKFEQIQIFNQFCFNLLSQRYHKAKSKLNLLQQSSPVHFLCDLVYYRIIFKFVLFCDGKFNFEKRF
jgi:hypothetical protein